MKLKGSAPLGSYPSRGDKESIPVGLPKENPAFLGKVMGSAADHSSLVMSIPAPMSGNTHTAEGAQWNDAEDGGSQGHLLPVSSRSANTDPNMSGPHPTVPIQNRYAETGSDWQENDCYLDFTWNTQNIPKTRLFNTGPASYNDVRPDFDDLGSIPGQPEVNGSDGFPGGFGGDSVSPQDSFGSGLPSTIAGIVVMPIVRRP